MPIQFINGKILFVNGKIAMHPDCCCGDDAAPCTEPPGLAATYFLTATLDEGDGDGNCLQRTVTDLQLDYIGAATWEGIDAQFGIWYLTLGVNGDCLWRIEVFAGGYATSTKATGQTPIGAYIDSATSCDGFGDAGLTNVSVSA